MTQNAPEQPAPATTGNPQVTTTGTPGAVTFTNTANPVKQPEKPQATADKQPPWGDKPEDFSPEKAWELIQKLRDQKGGDADELKAQVAAIQTAQESQKKALAEALGLTEPPKSEDALAETVKNLQAQFQASQREATILRLAAEKNIPAEYHDLLTETDPEKLAAQAEKVGALVVAKSAAEGTPAFQANPGQGKGTGAPVQDDSYPAHWLPQRQQ